MSTLHAPSRTKVLLRHRQRDTSRNSWLLAGAGALPLLAVCVGAVAARPVADDYSIEGTFQAAGSVGHAFSTWIHTWTSAYSMYALLTAGPRAERTIGTNVYYPLVSILVLGLFVTAVALIFRGWTRMAGLQLSRAARLGCTAVLGSVLLGSLTSFRHPTDPMLLGAIYWEAAWVPHLLPILLFPAVFIGVVQSARVKSPSARAALAGGWLLVGVVLAGFAFAETAFLGIATVTTTWAVWRVRERSSARRLLPFVGAVVVGLITGFIVVLLLPGTHARSVDYANHGVGLSRYHGLPALARALAKAGAQDALHSLATPALLLGFLGGFAVRRFVTHQLASESEATAVRVIGEALGATVIGWWIAVSFGDLASYVAWWHLLALTMLLTLFASLVGWGVAAHAIGRGRVVSWLRRTSLRSAAIALGVAMLWSLCVATAAAGVEWFRRPIVDANVSAARAVSAGRARPPAVWRSEPVGDLVDMTNDKTYWIDTAVSQWLRVPAAEFDVRSRSQPLRATVAIVAPK